MSWNISNIDNSVVLNKEQAIELSKFGKYKNMISQYGSSYEYEDEKEMIEDLFDFDYEKEVPDQFYLIFTTDHMEHMDYVWTIKNKLKKLKVKGDITFGSTEGDNAGTYWGYRFDGQGGMKELEGAVSFQEKKPKSKNKK